LIAVVMLFFVGQAYGKYAGYRRWQVGVVMVLIGLIMVGLTIALGG
jgi:VIT1/CCC1 family predicted Fe2+/Mn2+ transporter